MILIHYVINNTMSFGVLIIIYEEITSNSIHANEIKCAHDVHDRYNVPPTHHN